MIINAEETQAVSNLGWIDRGGLWLYGLSERTPRIVNLSKSKWLSICQGNEDFFVVVHHFEGNHVRLTAHSHERVEELISSVEVVAEAPKATNLPEIADVKFHSDKATSSFLPKAYFATICEKCVLLFVDWHRETVEVQPLPWHTEDTQEIYQGVVGLTEISDSQDVIISRQRQSEQVVYDPKSRKVVERFGLADRLGNPQLRFRRSAPELWASDYDTLLRLNPNGWETLDVLKLQDGSEGSSKLFVGEYLFNRAESLCVVARPFSGDVVGVDSNSFKITQGVALGGQPLDVGLLRGNRVIARDWKTGELSEGTLERV